MKTQQSRMELIRSMVILALFTALILLMTVTPLGMINLPLIKATILHVPVIIGSVLLGPKKGAFLGLVFGTVSLITNSVTPSLLSFAFSPMIPVPGSGKGSLWALVICFVPRILVGVIPALLWRALAPLARRNMPLRTLCLAVCGGAGAIVNTGLVMGLIYVVFKDGFAFAKGIPEDAVLAAIMAIVGANGVPECIAAVVLTSGVCLALIKATGLGVPAPGKKKGGSEPAVAPAADADKKGESK